MNRFLVWSARHPRTSLCLAVGVALLFGSGLPALRFETSKKALFADRDGEFERYEEFRANFGSDERIVVVATSPRLFEATTLSWLRAFDASLDDHEAIRSVESVFRPDRVVRRGNWLLPGALVEELPESDEAAETLLENALADPHPSGRLVAPDAMALCFLVELDLGADSKSELRAAAAVAELVEETSLETPEGLELFAVGSSLILVETEAAIRRDSVRIPLLAFALVVGTILTLFRGWAAAVPPAVGAILGTAATLGFVGWAGYAFTIAILPAVVLVAVVSTSEGIYLVVAFRESMRRGLDRSAAATDLGPALGKTILLASATSAVGFATVAATGNVGLQQFAVVGAAGSLLNLLVTGLVAPALLAILPSPARHKLLPPRSLRRLRTSLVRLRPRRRRRLAIACVATLAGIGFGVFRIDISTSFLNYLPRDNPLVERVGRFRELFGGFSHDSVVVETHEPGGTLRPGTVAELARLRAYLATRADSVDGLPDLLEAAERGFEELGIAGEALESIPAGLLRRFVDHDASRARFRIRSHAPRSADMLELERFVHAYPTTGFPPGTEISLMGTWAMVSRQSDRLVRDLLGGLALLAFATAAFLGLALRSLKTGLVALVPNLLPLLATLGAMGWLGIPLGFGVFAVGIVAFAVAANDTVHFLVTRRNRVARTGVSALAARNALGDVFHPIAATTAILVAGFLAMAASSLQNIRETGLLLAFAALAAMAADLLVTPALTDDKTFARRRNR